jgi:hypothetical protein
MKGSPSTLPKQAQTINIDTRVGDKKGSKQLKKPTQKKEVTPEMKEEVLLKKKESDETSEKLEEAKVEPA